MNAHMHTTETITLTIYSATHLLYKPTHHEISSNMMHTRSCNNEAILSTRATACTTGDPSFSDLQHSAQLALLPKLHVQLASVLLRVLLEHRTQLISFSPRTIWLDYPAPSVTNHFTYPLLSLSSQLLLDSAYFLRGPKLMKPLLASLGSSRLDTFCVPALLVAIFWLPTF